MDKVELTEVFQTATHAHYVISVHGIRTTGAWQKKLNPALEENGLKHRLFDYDYFKLTMFLNPNRRKKEIERFRDWVTDYIKDEHQPPSVIAHSFGTFIVGEALRLYKEVKLHRLILCGSIIHPAYSWTQIIKRGQVCNVLHEFSSKDVWAKRVAWVVKDAGPSGVKGFKDKVDGKVTDIHRQDFGHSDYFYDLHVRKVWIPFLKGADVQELEEVGNNKSPININFLIAKAVILTICIGASVLYGINKYFPPHSSEPESVKKPVESTAGKLPCPFGGSEVEDGCEVMKIKVDPPPFQRTDGQLFYDMENGGCPYYPTEFAIIRRVGNRCIIEAPNNIILYHTYNTVYYLPPATSRAAMSDFMKKDLYGDDYRDFAVKGENADEICRDECALDDKCNAFSYSSKAGRCWLKYRTPKKELPGTTISGVKIPKD